MSEQKQAFKPIRPKTDIAMNVEGEMEDKQQQEEVSKQDEDEARKPKMRRSPEEPTRQEREEHELTHLPFRSWCPCCIAGKARQWAHKRRANEKEEGDETPEMHLDYWFMREEGKEGSITIINHVEKMTKMHGAHVVKSKGTENDTAEKIIKDIEKLGVNGKIILRADQENAIQAVTQMIQRKRKGETLLEASKKYDSQSNGMAERGVQTIECQVRTMLIALEGRLEGKVSVFHPVVTWLVEHAADTINKFAVAPDGRTAYERVKGKRYKGEMIEFGRKVMYKIPCKPEGGADAGEMGARSVAW